MLKATMAAFTSTSAVERTRTDSWNGPPRSIFDNQQTWNGNNWILPETLLQKQEAFLLTNNHRGYNTASDRHEQEAD
jgi:hypothetical protein